MLEKLLLLPPYGKYLWSCLDIAKEVLLEGTGALLHATDDQIVWLGCCSTACLWWCLTHDGRNPGFVATLGRSGSTTSRRAAEELRQLGCEVTDSVQGRCYFRALGRPELLLCAHNVERVAVVVFRSQGDAITKFLLFEDASQEKCLDKIVEAAFTANWHHALLLWRCLRKKGLARSERRSLPSFRVSAKRSTKAGSSNAPSMGIEGALGLAIEQRLGWEADLDNPDLEVRVQLSKDELLISLSSLMQAVGMPGAYVQEAGLHPGVSWVLVKSLDIQPGDVVLDPMCGKGILLCEALLHWPRAATYLGSDVDPSQLECSLRNVACAERARANGGATTQLFRADTSLVGGLPLPNACVDKLVADLPFGKKHGTLEGNVSLYPSALAEFARVVKPGGRAVLLTSCENGPLMRAALIGKALSSLGSGEKVRENTTGMPDWCLECRRTFRLFFAKDACIYVLRRLATSELMPTSSRDCQGLLPWESGEGWYRQWMMERPGLIVWQKKIMGKNLTTGS